MIYDHVAGEVVYPANYSVITDPQHFPDETYRQWIRANLGPEHEERLYAMYNTHKTPGAVGKPFRSNWYAAENLVQDLMMQCPERYAAALLAEEQPVYRFYFDHEPVTSPFRSLKDPTNYIVYGPGACHGCEIPFVFLRDDSPLEYGIRGQGELELGGKMSQYWSNFAWNGDVNDATGRWASDLLTLPQWDRYGHKEDNTMVFSVSGATGKAELQTPHPNAVYCHTFWREFYEKKGWLHHRASEDEHRSNTHQKDAYETSAGSVLLSLSLLGICLAGIAYGIKRFTPQAAPSSEGAGHNWESVDDPE